MICVVHLHHNSPFFHILQWIELFGGSKNLKILLLCLSSAPSPPLRPHFSYRQISVCSLEKAIRLKRSCEMQGHSRSQSMMLVSKVLQQPPPPPSPPYQNIRWFLKELVAQYLQDCLRHSKYIVPQYVPLAPSPI